MPGNESLKATRYPLTLPTVAGTPHGTLHLCKYASHVIDPPTHQWSTKHALVRLKGEDMQGKVHWLGAGSEIWLGLFEIRHEAISVEDFQLNQEP